jgi:hypothetical protein
MSVDAGRAGEVDIITEEEVDHIKHNGTEDLNMAESCEAVRY